MRQDNRLEHKVIREVVRDKSREAGKGQILKGYVCHAK